MGTSRRWQLDGGAAERYLDVLEPAILGPAARVLVGHLELREGERILDVGCGTGAATLEASLRAGPGSRVIGVDVNRGMIEVARSRDARGDRTVEWLEASAVDLPLEAGSFDVVICAQTLQFVPDRPAAVSEIRRVLRPGGRTGLSVWAPLGDSPYFAALVAAISRWVGPGTAAGLEAAFGLDDEHDVRRILEEAGFDAVRVETVPVEIDLPPAAEFVSRHIGATPMATGYDAATPESRGQVVEQVATAMAPFAGPAGITVPFVQHLVRGVRP